MRRGHRSQYSALPQDAEARADGLAGPPVRGRGGDEPIAAGLQALAADPAGEREAVGAGLAAEGEVAGQRDAAAAPARPAIAARLSHAAPRPVLRPGRSWVTVKRVKAASLIVYVTVVPYEIPGDGVLTSWRTSTGADPTQDRSG